MLGYLNDLWVYRMNDSTWTWVSGSQVPDEPGVYDELMGELVPRGRSDAVGWFDSSSQELWVFGGYFEDGYYGPYFLLVIKLTNTPLNALNICVGNLNDLWRYDVNNDKWTWMSGSNVSNQGGVYGEKGNASSDNVPGARGSAVGWYDSENKEFWLFGGYGFDRNQQLGSNHSFLFVI